MTQQLILPKDDAGAGGAENKEARKEQRVETGQGRGLGDGGGEGVTAAHGMSHEARLWGTEGLEQMESSCQNPLLE